MTDQADAPPVSSLADLFAIAYQIELDAVERYTMLAAQMDSHNNAELAAVFRDLARAEGIHAGEIRRLAGDMDVATHAHQVAKWKKTESPEAADLGDAHYLMTRSDALKMALAAEERALAFFRHVYDSVTDPQIKEQVKMFVEEESEHVDLCHRLLQKHRPSGLQAASDDPDPATSQE
jgi:rubrerythrin